MRFSHREPLLQRDAPLVPRKFPIAADVRR
jgi:hypothetical protein